MAAVRERLVRPEEQLVLLFTAPLIAPPRDLGYIKGYLPGIRENGGRYTPRCGARGVHRAGDKLVFEPHVPSWWEEYDVDYRFGEALYRIRVYNRGAHDQPRVIVDGQETPGRTLSLSSGKATHGVEIYLGTSDG